MLRLCVTLFFLIPLLAHAHRPKRGKITGVWGPLWHQSFPTSGFHEFENRKRLGFSLSVAGDVDKNGGLDIGLAYLEQDYFIRETGSEAVERVKRWKATTGYRHWFGRDVSAGLFFVNSYSLGGAKKIFASGPRGDELKTTAHVVSDNGMEASLQYEFAQSSKLAGILDLRYSYSFTTEKGETPDMWGVLFGFKHFIQASQPDSDLYSR